MTTTEKTTKDLLVERGMPYEDIASAFGQMFSYVKSQQDLERGVQIAPSSALRGRGNEQADILIVSDFPDVCEVNTGYIGFSDYAMYLTILLNRLDIVYADVYWTTAIKYPNPKINMSLIKKEFPKLKAEIGVIQPSVILTLGTTSISAFASEPVKIDKAIGGDFSYTTSGQKEDIKVIPLYHPRHILEESPADFKKQTNQTWQSLKVLKELL